MVEFPVSVGILGWASAILLCVFALSVLLLAIKMFWSRPPHHGTGRLFKRKASIHTITNKR